MGMVEPDRGPVRPRVLLVVASMPLRSAIRRCLDGAHPCDCLETASGEEALGVSQVHEIDLLLIDALLPGMPALEAARRLKQQTPDARAYVMADPQQCDGFERDGAGLLAGTLGKDTLYDALQQLIRAFVAECRR